MATSIGAAATICSTLWMRTAICCGPMRQMTTSEALPRSTETVTSTSGQWTPNSIACPAAVPCCGLGRRTVRWRVHRRLPQTAPSFLVPWTTRFIASGNRQISVQRYQARMYPRPSERAPMRSHTQSVASTRTATTSPPRRYSSTTHLTTWPSRQAHLRTGHTSIPRARFQPEHTSTTSSSRTQMPARPVIRHPTRSRAQSLTILGPGPNARLRPTQRTQQ